VSSHGRRREEERWGEGKKAGERERERESKLTFPELMQ
jgi:hypothetical protein